MRRSRSRSRSRERDSRSYRKVDSDKEDRYREGDRESYRVRDIDREREREIDRDRDDKYKYSHRDIKRPSREREQFNYREQVNLNLNSTTRRPDTSRREYEKEKDRDKNYSDYKTMSKPRLYDNDSHSNSHSNSNSHPHLHNRIPRDQFQYLAPTTESLHAKKLATLDHEKFLIDRQREREGKPDVGHLIWPETPPRGEFYFGDVLIKNEDEDEDEDEVEGEGEGEGGKEQETVDTETSTVEATATVMVTTDHNNDSASVSDSEDKFGPSIKIKAPSATSKPNTLINLNSFSSNKGGKYGGDMMPGEGSAMAGFVAQGQRIPRRGEIGLDSTEISRFESAGFVMSGSRHHMMNAVRMRKENQVISAEEKTMISQMAIEERIKREEEIVKTFKTMVEEKFKQNKK